jgi:hypothetical protein
MMRKSLLCLCAFLSCDALIGSEVVEDAAGEGNVGRRACVCQCISYENLGGGKWAVKVMKNDGGKKFTAEGEVDENDCSQVNRLIRQGAPAEKYKALGLAVEEGMAAIEGESDASGNQLVPYDNNEAMQNFVKQVYEMVNMFDDSFFTPRSELAFNPLEELDSYFVPFSFFPWRRSRVDAVEGTPRNLKRARVEEVASSPAAKPAPNARVVATKPAPKAKVVASGSTATKPAPKEEEVVVATQSDKKEDGLFSRLKQWGAKKGDSANQVVVDEPTATPSVPAKAQPKHEPTAEPAARSARRAGRPAPQGTAPAAKPAFRATSASDARASA